MLNSINSMYKELSKPLINSRKISIFITLCSIFGGLLVAYLAMTLLVFIIPGSLGESISIPLLFNTLAWAVTALYISISTSKLAALKKVLIPSVIFATLILIFYIR